MFREIRQHDKEALILLQVRPDEGRALLVDGVADGGGAVDREQPAIPNAPERVRFLRRQGGEGVLHPRSELIRCGHTVFADDASGGTGSRCLREMTVTQASGARSG